MSWIRRHVAAALDLVWPPRCPACGARAAIATEHWCERCWAELRPVRDPGAERLAAAFAVDARFLDILATAKYRRYRRVGLRLAREAAALLAPRVAAAAAAGRAGAGHTEGAAEVPVWLVPVPLTRVKRRERGFNQAADFAAAVSARCGVPVAADWLRRVRGGRALAGRGRAERAGAIAGAFVAGAPAATGTPARILLVDDVYTTGSTLADCERAVTAAGSTVALRIVMGRAFAARDDVAPAAREILGRL